MPFTLQTHQFRRGRANQRVLVKEVPYKAFSNNGERLFVQSGKVWSEGGEEITNPPGWFWEAYEQTKPEKKAILGLDGPPRKSKTAA